MDAGGSQGKEKKKKGHMEITWKLEIKINFAHCLFNTCIEKKIIQSISCFIFLFLLQIKN